MKILAILQNQWFKKPEVVEELIKKRGEDYRSLLIRYALFAGCLTGRRLKEWLGEELCDVIHWDESSRKIFGNSIICPPPDYKHIYNLLERIEPDMIIAFGVNAQRGLFGAMKSVKEDSKFARKPIHIFDLPHPTCRGKQQLEYCRIGCKNIREIYESTKKPTERSVG